MTNQLNRRRFLTTVGLTLEAATLAAEAPAVARVEAVKDEARNPFGSSLQDQSSSIDFRYSPLSWQTAFCFPDDPHKSLVGERGELRYGHPGTGGKGQDDFPEIVEFSLRGMEHDQARQHLEAPGIPVIHTRLDRPEAYLELTIFATNFPEEGRVDNLILEVRPRTQKLVHAVPLVTIRTAHEVTVQSSNDVAGVYLDGQPPRLFLVSDSPLDSDYLGSGRALILKQGIASYDRPLRYCLRFPQQGQGMEKVQAGPAGGAADRLLLAARAYWQSWKPFQGKVTLNLPGRYGEFLVACARNILQAREVRDGKLTFQVGPTVYRGLWVVDGNFILEAARYLGYDAEAQQGLEATWSRQAADGSITAGAGREHWKDTAIAMFTLVRQAELSQDWSYFRQMQLQILRGAKFLMDLRDKARSEGSANGRYGLLARGFGDGGLEGLRSEFTNTLWALAGLKAVTEAADQLGLAGFEEARKFYNELRSAFIAAAREEMRLHPAGFAYLPMLMKEDAQWSAPDEWDRPRPQSGQWALSHAIYPGLVFSKDDPVVRGHMALMQACTQEEVPAETGWLPHQGLWTYNAPFVAHVYLWAGLADWARQTFVGFLNHASPLYCWREEQPLRGSLVCGYVGDMPHNWASAECILYLRHMLALEDGPALRLLEGIGDFELASGEGYQIAESPTRFGRVSLTLEPLDRRQGWSLGFERSRGPHPGSVQLPATLGTRFHFAELRGANFTRQGSAIQVAPEATSWQAFWKV
jgi:hypothetical protein